MLALLFGWLLLPADPARAAEPTGIGSDRASTLRIAGGQDAYRLGTHLELLEDPSRELSLADVRSPAIAERFRRSDVPAPNLGFTASAVWVRLQLESGLADRALYYLEIAYPLLDRITVFIDDRHRLTRYDTGDRTPFATRPLGTRMFVFPLELEPDRPLQVYLRLQSESAMNLPMLLLTPRGLSERIAAQYSVLSLYYGVLVMLIIYNLYHYIRLRDKNALLYVVFIVNYIGFQLALNGISFQYFWPDSVWWANANLPFFICTTCLAGTLFTRSILNTARYTPRTDLLLRALRWIAAAGAGLALFGPYPWAIKFAVALVFALIVFIAVGIRISVMGFRPARYYTLAWGVSLTGMAIYALKTYGLLPTNFITTWSTQIGSAWDAVVLAFAISDRFYLIQDEKRRVQATARKQLAESNRKLNQLNDELESRVAAGLQELRSSNVQLRAEAEVRRKAERKADAANRAKSEFLANISHEIRTPMNAIIGYVHMLSRTTLGRDQRNHLVKIDQAAHTLLGIIKDILDFSKIEAGRLDLEPAPFRVEELIDKACNLVELSATQKGLALELQHNVPTDCCLIGDEGRLLQVLLNLLANGVKFTESGTVRLRLDYEPDGADAARLRFAVEDTGVGIAPEQQAGLFDPFTQADTSITRRFGGTGLGLSISQRLVRRMGGDIQVTSKVGEGSRFAFTLGFARAAPEQCMGQARMDQEIAVGEFNGARILLVEDQPLNQEIAIGFLHAAGAAVDVAGDGAEALRRLRLAGAAGYDLVLMDVQMSGLDGYATTARIRNELGLRKLPIVAMTAHATAGAHERCLSAGMNDYIVKPIDIGTLMRMLHRWCRVDADAGSTAVVVPADSRPGCLPDSDRRRLLAQLYAEHRDDAELIRALIAAGDREAAARTAHGLAGVALNLGADDIGNAARALEQQVAATDNDMEAELATLSSSLQALGQADVGRKDADSPISDGALEGKALIAVLVELSKLLGERNLRARQRFDEVLARVADPAARRSLQAAGGKIEALDFDAARRSVDALLEQLDTASD